MVYHNPENKLRINTIWAVMSVDPEGRHGIMAAYLGPLIGVSPMITGDPELLEEFKRIAREAGELGGKKPVLVRFDRVSEDEPL